MDRDCNRCIWSTRDGGCSSWECKFVDKHEAYEAYKIYVDNKRLNNEKNFDELIDE